MQIRDIGGKSISRQALFQNSLTRIISTVKLKRIRNRSRGKEDDFHHGIKRAPAIATA